MSEPTDEPVTRRDSSARRVDSPSAPSEPALPPITSYEDEGPLGNGGMGEVRACRDSRLDRTIAIKTLKAEHLANPEMLARFLREASVQGRLEHPAIVPVYDVGLRDGVPYFTMKRVRGLTLAEILARRGDAALAQRYSRRKLLAALSHVALAVHYAHVKGVLHRDLKPSNIMFGDFGEVYVLDWGIAHTGGHTVDDHTGPTVSGLTAAGAIAGTVGYMAPEQLRGELVDRRADVYALGCILYELLAATPLHDRTTLDATQQSTLRGVDVEALIGATAPDTAPELVTICARSLASSPGARFESALALHDALEKYLDGDRDLERRHALSREHTTAARASAALAIEDQPDALEQRQRSLREVGRALALDPDNTEALEVLVGLLKMRPRRIPPDAATRLERARIRVMMDMVPAAGWHFLAPGLALPLIAAMGIRSWAALMAIIGSAVLAAASAFGFGRWWPVEHRAGNVAAHARRLIPLMFSAIVFTASLSLLFGPFVFVPAACVLLAIAFTFHLGTRAVAALAVIPILAPMLLQWAGVLPTSYRFVSGAMEIQAVGTYLPQTLSLVLLALGCTLAVLVATTVASRFRRSLFDVVERAELYAWQLEHMSLGRAPDIPSESATWESTRG